MHLQNEANLRKEFRVPSIDAAFLEHLIDMAFFEYSQYEVTDVAFFKYSQNLICINPILHGRGKIAHQVGF